MVCKLAEILGVIQIATGATELYTAGIPEKIIEELTSVA